MGEMSEPKQTCPDDCKDVLKFLEDASIVTVRYEDGKFTLTEGCDNYFEAILTPIQLATLAAQLATLAANNK